MCERPGVTAEALADSTQQQERRDSAPCLRRWATACCRSQGELGLRAARPERRLPLELEPPRHRGGRASTGRLAGCLHRAPRRGCAMIGAHTNEVTQEAVGAL